MSAEIVVRGEGEVRSLPDRAVSRVAVEADADSQTDAFTAASRSAAAVDAVLDKYAEALDRRITVGVVVRPKTRWKKGESVNAGWVAGRTTILDIKDLVKLGPLISELPGAGASVIHGPSWEVNPDNPVHDRARQAAAVDARRRATAYAQALGQHLGASKWLSEPGFVLQGSSQPLWHAPLACSGMARFRPKSQWISVLTK
jgi:uncharacterized protein